MNLGRGFRGHNNHVCSSSQTYIREDFVIFNSFLLYGSIGPIPDSRTMQIIILVEFVELNASPKTIPKQILYMVSMLYSLKNIRSIRYVKFINRWPLSHRFSSYFIIYDTFRLINIKTTLHSYYGDWLSGLQMQKIAKWQFYDILKTIVIAAVSVTSILRENGVKKVV